MLEKTLESPLDCKEIKPVNPKGLMLMLKLKLKPMESLRVGHDSAISTFTFHFHALEQEMATHSSVLAWRIQGRGSLVGCRLWGCTESDTTEAP